MLLNKFRLLFVQQHFPTTAPGAFEFCTRIIRVCINIFTEIAVESNMQISNISKRCNLQFTTWCVFPNEISGPWMSRRGQGRCSKSGEQYADTNLLGSFREIPVCRKGGGGYYEKLLRKVSRKPYSLDQYSFKQHYALGLMFTQFRKQQLQSYSFHSRDRPRPLM